jgi:hypothetical protein
LFNDVDEKVRAEAAKCFFQFERDELGNYRKLVEDFVESRAFTTNYRELIRALEKTTAKLPDITCSICEKIVRISKSSNPSDASHIPYADKISKLLIRVYSQSKDEKLRSHGSNRSLRIERSVTGIWKIAEDRGGECSSKCGIDNKKMENSTKQSPKGEKLR